MKEILWRRCLSSILACRITRMTRMVRLRIHADVRLRSGLMRKKKMASDAVRARRAFVACASS